MDKLVRQSEHQYSCFALAMRFMVLATAVAATAKVVATFSTALTDFMTTVALIKKV